MEDVDRYTLRLPLSLFFLLRHYFAFASTGGEAFILTLCYSASVLARRKAFTSPPTDANAERHQHNYRMM